MAASWGRQYGSSLIRFTVTPYSIPRSTPWSVSTLFSVLRRGTASLARLSHRLAVVELACSFVSVMYRPSFFRIVFQIVRTKEKMLAGRQGFLLVGVPRTSKALERNCNSR
jgi:hypothetical protein